MNCSNNSGHKLLPRALLLRAVRALVPCIWIAGGILLAALLPEIWRTTVEAEQFALRDVGFLSDCLIGEGCW